MAKDKYQIDMCHGPLFGKILMFALPLMLANMLQLLFHAADLIVVGQFSGSHEAVAAIGCTSSMYSFYVNIFIGLSVGTNVLVARFTGAKDSENVRKAVHSSMTFALLGGIIVGALAIVFSEPLLRGLDTPPEILPLATRYSQICFGALPFVMIYNFGCAVLRAVGDTRRPFIFLVSAGIINVILNLILVLCFKMSVEGVAIATVASHIVAATLILHALCKSNSDIRLSLKELRIDFRMLKDMLRIGVPAGIQSSSFSVSNMLIQSSINSFGSYAMAGTTAALGLEGITYVSANAFHYTVLSFTAQNLGGQHYKRILRSSYYCLFLGALVCGIVGWLFYLSSGFFLSFYNSDPQVIAWGILRMKILFTTYFICALMDASTGVLRGLGYSILSTIICLSGACVFRVFWVLVVFPRYRTMECLLYSYPVSWTMVAIVSTIAYAIIYRKILREQCPRFVDWKRWNPSIPRGCRHTGTMK